MEVSQYTRVEFSNTHYVGGALDPYFAAPITLSNIRNISQVAATYKTDTVSGWGQSVETPYEIPETPGEVEFMVNLNRVDWLANAPLPTLWKDKRERACRIIYRSTALDSGFQLKFVCKPASWSLSTSLTDATVIRCSLLITSVIEPELL
jgi:hypothetical protein